MPPATRPRLPLAPTKPGFAAALAEHGHPPLSRKPLTTLQINLGKRCNLACLHCHVGAGPKRKERMDARTAGRVLDLLAQTPEIELVDLTGGAPELNPQFRRLVKVARAHGRRVIDRCNLTVLWEPNQDDLPEFLAEQRVEVVASLPCYGPENVDKQRGRGAFAGSIRALRRLNGLGYGQPGSELSLTLVYNPVGPALPPAQGPLEACYRERLREDFGIEFHHLITITNMPLDRFAATLQREDKLETYQDLLQSNFNPDTLAHLMCRTLISVSWDGALFDCDFNQMQGLPIANRPRSIWDIEDFGTLGRGLVATGLHCFGCTAGAGSSCSGALQP